MPRSRKNHAGDKQRPPPETKDAETSTGVTTRDSSIQVTPSVRQVAVTAYPEVRHVASVAHPGMSQESEVQTRQESAYSHGVQIPPTLSTPPQLYTRTTQAATTSLPSFEELRQQIREQCGITSQHYLIQPTPTRPANQSSTACSVHQPHLPERPVQGGADNIPGVTRLRAFKIPNNHNQFMHNSQLLTPHTNITFAHGPSLYNYPGCSAPLRPTLPPASPQPTIPKDRKIKCFNCGDQGHHFTHCPMPSRGIFCYRCGKSNCTVKNCPNCADYMREKGPHSPFKRPP